MSVKKDRVVPLRIFNVFDEVHYLAAENVVALVKLLVDITSLEIYDENHERVVGQARVNTSACITRNI